MLQIEEKIVSKAGIPSGCHNVFPFAGYNEISSFLKSGDSVFRKNSLQVPGGIFEMPVNIIGVIVKPCAFGYTL